VVVVTVVVDGAAIAVDVVVAAQSRRMYITLSNFLIEQISATKTEQRRHTPVLMRNTE